MEDGWVRGPMRKMIMAFEKSLKDHPPIAPGAPDQVNPCPSSAKLSVDN
jgi:arylsulfatase